MEKHSFFRGLSIAVILLGILLVGSCLEDFEYVPSSGNLEFSKDTVFLDTIFTNIGSSTYSLKVYNPTDDDLLIPFVGMETGQESSYRLNVDGLAGKEFTDIPILAKDSLFVFVETTFDVEQTGQNSFLLSENLLFGNGSNAQRVPLVTLVKDAVFLFPPTLPDGSSQTVVLGTDELGNEIRVPGFDLAPDQLNFTNEKPYVVYGYAVVPETQTLTMNPGVRVHFHNNSGMVVNSGANLQINGELSMDSALLENEVVFEGDRLESTYADEPGQWGTIWIKAGSEGNQINHLTIRNAATGIRIAGDPVEGISAATLRNVQIYNSLNDNLWATSANVNAENLVLGSAGNTSVTLDLGGNHQFVHCTFGNYWSNGFRRGPALSLSNSNGTAMSDLENANFINCIIFGSASREIALQQDPGAEFNFLFQNCLIKFEDPSGEFSENPLYNFEDTDLYPNSLLNQSPEFLQPFQDQFQIGENSAAIDAAESNIPSPLPSDIIGNDRTQNPDIGAYESTN